MKIFTYAYFAYLHLHNFGHMHVHIHIHTLHICIYIALYYAYCMGPFLTAIYIYFLSPFHTPTGALSCAARFRVPGHPRPIYAADFASMTLTHARNMTLLLAHPYLIPMFTHHCCPVSGVPYSIASRGAISQRLANYSRACPVSAILSRIQR